MATAQKVALSFIKHPPGNDTFPTLIIRTVQQEMLDAFLACLEDWKGVRAGAVKTMREKLPALKTALNKADKEFKKAFEKTPQATTATTPERKQIYADAHSTKLHELYDPVVKDAEKSYYYGFLTLGSFMWEIENVVRERGFTLGFLLEGDETRLTLGDKFGLNSVPIGSVFRRAGRNEPQRHRDTEKTRERSGQGHGLQLSSPLSSLCVSLLCVSVPLWFILSGFSYAARISARAR